jgi:serine/threonine protein kinase
MGAVYEAVDQRLGHTVAVKELIVTGKLLRKAFEEEARRLAPLRHPALPNVSDHFTEGAGQYLVMDFISGNDLGELIERRGSPFEVEWVVKWTQQLLGALEYLHSQQPAIIHRDIKPSNLKLTRPSDIILLDFGLSKGGTLGSALQTRL